MRYQYVRASPVFSARDRLGPDMPGMDMDMSISAATPRLLQMPICQGVVVDAGGCTCQAEWTCVSLLIRLWVNEKMKTCANEGRFINSFRATAPGVPYVREICSRFKVFLNPNLQRLVSLVRSARPPSSVITLCLSIQMM